MANSVLMQHRVKLQQGATSQQDWGDCVHDDTKRHNDTRIIRKTKVKAIQ